MKLKPKEKPQPCKVDVLISETMKKMHERDFSLYDAKYFADRMNKTINGPAPWSDGTLKQIKFKLDWYKG